MTSRQVDGRKFGIDTPKAPYEATDTLRSVQRARIIDLISEGEIEGLVRGHRSITFDDVPLQNEDGTYNFEGVTVDTRNGTADQEPFENFSYSERQVDVGIELKFGDETSRVIYDDTVDTVVFRVSMPALSYVDKNGNTVGTRVDFRFYIQPSDGPRIALGDLTLEGKASSRYDRDIAFKLVGQAPWRISVERLTADDNTSDHRYRNQTYWSAYVERITAKLQYPFSAVVATVIDASQFSSIPTRGFEIRGKKVLVPANRRADMDYLNAWDGVSTPQYVGFWDGKFKDNLEWTRNPAWALFDLMNARRYGLGKWTNPAAIPGETPSANPASPFIDKWTTYEIGKYCDGMVPNGKGGLEPRFAIACYLQNDSEAFALLNQMSSVFRGLVCWANANALLSSDRPQDPIFLFTNANVVDGTFSYSGSDRRSRVTAVFVAYNNPDDNYKRDVVYVEDARGIARYGYNPMEITAFGCASYGQARRAGLWTIFSSVYETAQVVFRAGMSAATLLPGQVISVQDEHRNGLRWGGFVRDIGSDVPDGSPVARPYVIVDAPLNLVAGSNYEFSFTTDKNTYTIVDAYGKPVVLNADTADVQDLVFEGDSKVMTARVSVSSDGEYTKLYFVDGAPSGRMPNVGGMWTLSEPATAVQQNYRVMAVTDQGEGVFEVTAVEYDSEKYASIEKEFVVPEETSAPTIRSTVPRAVTAITHSESLYLENLVVKSSLTVSWRPPSDAASFRVRYRYDGIVENTDGSFSPAGNGNWTSLASVNESTVTLQDMQEGFYLFEVSCKNVLGFVSATATYQLRVLGKSEPPSAVSSDSIEATLEPGGVLIKWKAISDLDRDSYVVRATPLDVGDYYGQEELVADTKGTTALYAAAKGKGARFGITIQSFDTGGRGSTHLAYKEVAFTPPAIVENFVVYQNVAYLDMHWDSAARAAYYVIRAGESWETAEKIGETVSPQLSIEWGRTGEKTFWVRAYDDLGNPSNLPTGETLDVAKPPQRNVVLDFDEDPSFTGLKFHMGLVGVQLALEEGHTYGEYIATHELADTFTMLVTMDSEVVAVFESGLTWADLDYSWNDPRAHQQWVKVGEVSQIEIQHFVATDEALDASVAALWSLSDLAGLSDEVASVGPEPGYSAPLFSAGKFGDGLIVDDKTTIEWDVPLGEEWTVYLTYRFDASDAGRRLLNLGGTDSMHLRYDNQRLTFILQASDGKKIELARKVSFTATVDQIQAVMRAIGFPYQQFVLFETTSQADIDAWVSAARTMATADHNGDGIVSEQWQEYTTVDFWAVCQEFLVLLSGASSSLLTRTGSAYQAFESFCSKVLVDAGLTFSIGSGDMVFFGMSQFLDTKIILGQTVTRKKRSLMVKKHGDSSYLYAEIDADQLDISTLSFK